MGLRGRRENVGKCLEKCVGSRASWASVSLILKLNDLSEVLEGEMVVL